MLILNADQKQKQLFQDLIRDIDSQVVWNGRFIFMKDCLILEGVVRSVVFHFDMQKAQVEMTDFLTDDNKELEVADYPGMEDFIAMAVYVFAKRGFLTQIDVRQSIAELEQVFGEILGTYDLNVIFTDDRIEFYQSGKRMTYEDAAKAAIARSVKGSPQTAAKEHVCKLAIVKRGSAKEADAASMLESQAKVSDAAQNGQEEIQDRQAAEQRIEKYQARIGVFKRLSDLQRKTLIRDIRYDKLLNDQDRETLHLRIQEAEYQSKMEQIEEELKAPANRTYAYVQKLIKKAQKDDLFEKTKQAVLERLNEICIEYGRQEVRKIMEKTPPHVERAEYKALMEKLAPYEALDLTEYKQTLRNMQETLEIKEISNMLMQSRKKSREDYVALLQRIEEQNFARESAAPYIERILDRIEEFDKTRLNKLLSSVNSMDFETAASLYEMIAQESFLPKLRAGALAVVSRRLQEISLRECGNFVKILKNSMDPVLRDHPRHYFYPAEQILQKSANLEHKKRMDHALASFVEKKGLFEYPIFMADTSKEGDGADGLLLTMEHIFYSTRLSGYRIKITSVRSIYVYTGLLNHKSLIVEQTDGTKHKVPYVVDADTLNNWAEVLNQFIRRLQEYPVCETLSYDALEGQRKTSCKRCGCIFEEGGKCPECGFGV